jgi:uncharacterized protein
MLYRRFGKTEQRLSAFSFGGMRFLSSEENAVATVFKAVELGINHLETAKGYGKSEEYIGAAFQAGLARQSIYLTTKMAPTPDRDSMAQLIERSLTRLKTDYLDNLALHGLNTPQHFELVTKKDGCMKAVQEAVEAGLIRHVGFSTHGSLELILDLIDTDLFEFINLHYYYFNQRNAAAVQRAYEKDMGIFIISPTDKGGQLYAPPEKLKALCQPFTPIELNHRFLLSDPRIHTLSLGAASPEEFAAHVTVADQGMPLTPKEQQALGRLEQALVEIKPDLCEQCFACLPCPENINIPEVLRLRNLAVGLDMVDFGQYRYNMFEKAGHWFPGTKGNRCTDCGDCLPRCPVDLPIPTLLRDADQRLAAGERKRLWED